MKPNFTILLVIVAIVVVGIVIISGFSAKEGPINPSQTSRRPTAEVTARRDEDVRLRGRQSQPQYEHDPSPSDMDKKPRSKGEGECRRVLEMLYGVRFPSAYPEWLRSPETKRQLELDCYAQVPASLIRRGHSGYVEIACEYNGAQHYRQVTKYQPTEDAFAAQVWNDEFKKQMCREVGVHLIIVPHTIKLNLIEDFIKSELGIRGLLPQ